MVKPEGQRRQQGHGRIEVKASAQFILERLRTGHHLSAIYAELSDRGSISVSYRQFHRLVTKLQTSTPARPPVALVSTSDRSSPSSGFRHDPDPRKDYFSRPSRRGGSG